jgi:hypothetical protein
VQEIKSFLLICEFIGFILGVVVLIFTFLLTRRRDEVQKNIVLNIPLLLIVFSIGGLFAGFMIGHSIEYPSPKFTRWELLVSPVKFVQITDLNHYGVWAQTTEGKLYVWDFSRCQYPATCNQWVEADNVPNDAHENGQQPLNKSEACPQSTGSPSIEPPGKIIECASIPQPNGPALSDIYYALLEDGTIWRWSPPAGTDVPILSMFIGPFIGLLLGAIGGSFLILRMKRKKSRQPMLDQSTLQVAYLLK